MHKSWTPWKRKKHKNGSTDNETGKATPFTNANINIPIYLHATAVERAAREPFLAAGPFPALSQSSTTSGDASRSLPSLFLPNRWGGGDALRSFFLRPRLGEANARAAPTTTGLSMPTSTGREASHSSQESHSSGLKSLHRTQRQAAGGVGGEREREVMVGAWGELGKRRKRRRRRRSFRIRNGAHLSRERSRAQGWSHEFWVKKSASPHNHGCTT